MKHHSFLPMAHTTKETPLRDTWTRWPQHWKNSPVSKDLFRGVEMSSGGLGEPSQSSDVCFFHYAHQCDYLSEGCEGTNQSLADLRSLFSEGMRIADVILMCDLAMHNLESVPPSLILQAADRVEDSMELVKKITMQKLLGLYHLYIDQCFSKRMEQKDHFEMIAYSLIKHYMNERYHEPRSQNLELILGQDLFPSDFSINFRAHHWIHFFKFFSPSDKKVLEDFLFEKQRFQMHMKDYLKKKEENSSRGDLLQCMSSYFSDSSSARKYFQMLDEIKDDDIFKALNYFVNEQTVSECGLDILEKCLNNMEDESEFCAFVKLISLKSSYSIFTIECVDEMLYLLLEGRVWNFEFALDLLYVILNVFPELLEEKIEYFLKLFMVKSDRFIELYLDILFRLSRRISITLCDLYPFLERICLTGTPPQSRCAISIIDSLIDASDQSYISILCEELLAAGQMTATIVQSLECIVHYFPSHRQVIRKSLSRLVGLRQGCSYGRTFRIPRILKCRISKF